MNPLRGDVSIIINGIPRILRLTLGALAEIEEALGTDDLDGLAKRLGRLSARDLFAILRALLKGGGDNDAAECLANEPLDLPQALGAVTQAFAAGFGGNEAPGKPGGGTGPDGAGPGSA